ncbi:flagellar basal body L-ring protein FlgH [Hyphococcus flavus]|uniref:Flagellar L-ring protein n=1 Tax=Hyphococcus flavus TaxID=1866326 RepID=A0AAF0CFL6_9PROT|nr:flagellar basal body L-ring protein FlgH [Hyphococcus flavus]WDI31544.1 flagellar basal body L-ring protein FlgH [Hyphococcus flavus]
MTLARYSKSAALIALVATAGCSSSRLDHMFKPPSMSPVGEMRNPMPAPAPERYNVPPKNGGVTEPTHTTASLWHSGPTSLFGDRRARKSGDIVTVVIEIDEEAEMKNRTDRSRSSSDGLSVPALLGVPSLAQDVLPGGAGLDPAIDASSNNASSGDGTIKREERITLRIAATVIGELPNGHLAISGSQEIRVNYELRELLVGGIIRPEDIARNNTITYDKIADARISYGGRGQISDLQKARYGSQILDMISPF